MKALSVARKSLLELWREPLLLGLLLAFPAAMVCFYYFAFGQTEAGLATYLSVLVADDDAGVTLADGTRWQAGLELVEAIRAAEWEGDPVFDVEVVTDRQAAEIRLRERKVSLLVLIPPDYSQRLQAGGTGSSTSPPSLTLVGDPGADSYVFARSFLTGLAREFAREFAKAVANRSDEPLILSYEFIPGTGTMSDFEWGVGGLIVFGIMFVMITTATVLVREKVAGTLRRLRLTRASAADLLLGVTLAQMVVAAVQIPITFGTALALGFHNNGSLLLAMGIGLILNLSAVGLGLGVACFARDDGEATNLASGMLVPVVFLSGAVFPLPETPIMTIAGRTIQLWDIMPTSHAAEALRRVLVFGESPGSIAYELGAMTLLSVLILALGVVLYQRLRMRES